MKPRKIDLSLAILIVLVLVLLAAAWYWNTRPTVVQIHAHVPDDFPDEGFSQR